VLPLYEKRGFERKIGFFRIEMEERKDNEARGRIFATG
jgi:hypothetical protein